MSHDGMDSLKGDDDYTPFRDIMNEFYARDTSREIRSSLKAKGISGRHTAVKPLWLSEIPAVHLARHGAGLNKANVRSLNL